MKGDDMDQMEYDPDEGRESECVTCDPTCPSPSCEAARAVVKQEAPK